MVMRPAACSRRRADRQPRLALGQQVLELLDRLHADGPHARRRDARRERRAARGRVILMRDGRIVRRVAPAELGGALEAS
jgi:hypothetical protein